MADLDRTGSIYREEKLPLRPANVVMDLERLGGLHPFRLSFMRILMRRIMQEKWRIERSVFDLDDDGYGTALYRIHACHRTYSFVVFAHHLDPEMRSDRVIANQWDMTVTLCEGQVDDDQLQMLRKNVPLQEAGRIDARSIVLSRANKSSRNFEYVVGELACGRQPALDQIARVGYLYRTTAVYGSGKFGMADWQKVRSRYADFARPFAAEMFTCYMIRQFSLEQAEHIARARAPKTAVAMRDAIKRFFGIGNATGLGMAPFLVNHPQLISRWIEVRETALARVLQMGEAGTARRKMLLRLIAKAAQHLAEVTIDNDLQNGRNAQTIDELAQATDWIEQQADLDWPALTDKAMSAWSLETQELLNTLLIEMYPELVDDLEECLCVDESMELIPDQPLSELRATIERHYRWALSYDFDEPGCRDVFWYRSEEKAEPRLGRRGIDAGEERAMAIPVAYDVQRCHRQVCDSIAAADCANVAEFGIRFPELRSTIRRIQTMSQMVYGDIHANLADEDVLPIHLLRCKLSFFGVSKFDPKSRLWVRNTMFQGAPITGDIGGEFSDDWYFPVTPTDTRVID